MKMGNHPQYSVENTPTLPDSPLKRKTYFFLGSSVTYGSASEGEAMSDFLAKRNGCTCIKEAVPGTTLADNGPSSYVGRLNAYLQNPGRAEKLDAFVCQLSTNDTRNPDLGRVTAATEKTLSAFDKTTTFGAIETIIATVKEVWDCPIVFYTNSRFPNERYAKMVTELEKIGRKWNIAVLDLYSDDAFNGISAEERALYMYDEVHPTRAGYREWWLPKFENVLKTL